MKILMYLLFCGGTFTFIGISGMAGDDASIVVFVGLAFLAVAGLITLLGYRLGKQADRKEALKEMAEDAEKEKARSDSWRMWLHGG